MATYTPNLNLGKPEATDAFSGFRQLFNDNMDILDNGGGGGSGGHTIIDPNGNSLPQESGLQFTGNVSVTDDSGNGKTVVDILGGGGNVYGAFIDTNRVLATYNSSGGSAIPSYTALEDCFVAFYVFGKNSQTCRIYVDSAEILTVYFQGDGVQSPTLYLKKGQTLSFSSFDYWSFHYEVYGLTQGTNGIFAPIIYSDTERVVGVWRDNKPLYQITIDLGSDRTFSSGWQSFANKADYPDYDYISAGMLYATSGVCTNVDIAHNDSTYLELRPKASAGGRYLTYQYTKTTDVAGSGNWNTDGVPTVHYSTSEQVIGTWENKPLYQISIFLTSGISVGSYGHVTLPVNSIVRDWFGTIYRNSYLSVDKFNGYIDNGDIFCSIRSGNLEYYISNVFSGIDELDFTVQYTKSTD